MNRTFKKTVVSISLVAMAAAGCSAKSRQEVAAEQKQEVAIADGKDNAFEIAKPEAEKSAADPAASTIVPVGGSGGTTTGANNMPAPPPLAGPMRDKGKNKVGDARGYGGVGRKGLPAKRPPADGIFGGEADQEGNSESYAHYDVNKMTDVVADHLSTFAVDVDTASYTIARRKIMDGQAVPRDAVRVEEFLNYFRYAYAGPGDDRPFAVHMEAAPSPFSTGRQLVRVGVQGKSVAQRDRKKAHLVFLVDVSGSMQGPDRLPLAQRSLRILVDNLGEGDTVALVTYAGSTRVVLEPTTMEHKAEIHAAIDELTAGGSTAMGSGLELAYGIAARQIEPDAVTRVIVLSDGDANVGKTSHEEILATIKGHVAEGITLSTIGFGVGNYRDNLMEQLANKGNGNNFYIDGLSQAKRVFQEQLGGTLEVIAQDVKIQVDWNKDAVKSYRLVGYENRDIADDDFRDDKVDAGEIGAGHAVTAVYEVELVAKPKGSLATVRVRAKKPRGQEAAEYAYPFAAEMQRASFDTASQDFRFAVAVMAFAEILRKSPYAEGWSLDRVLGIARNATPAGNEEREEFLQLVGKAAKSS